MLFYECFVARFFFAGKIAVSQYLDFRTVLSLMVRNKKNIKLSSKMTTNDTFHY